MTTQNDHAERLDTLVEVYELSKMTEFAAACRAGAAAIRREIERAEDREDDPSDRQVYGAEIRRLALDVLQTFADEECYEDVYDTLHERIDGHAWVIYTAKAQAVLVSSENDGAAVDEFGADWIVTDGAINWSRLAFGAMRQDVVDQLCTLGGDWQADRDSDEFREALADALERWSVKAEAAS